MLASRRVGDWQGRVGSSSTVMGSCIVGGDTSRGANWTRCSDSFVGGKGERLLVREQCGDCLDGVAHVLTPSVVAGEGSPVLETGDAVFDADAARGMGLASLLVDLLVPVRGVLLELAMRWRHHAPTGLGAQALVAGIREDLHRRAVGQESDQP